MLIEQAEPAVFGGKSCGEVGFSAPSAWCLLSGWNASKNIPIATSFFKI
jgi:hypothetical protein